MNNQNYIKEIINDYCVIDLETTGLSFEWDEIIEIGILKIRDNKIINEYSQLIKPEYTIDEYITDLTGINSTMLANMPSIDLVKDEVLEFIGDDIIIGYNTSFDIKFLESGFNVNLQNQYMDIMQFARKMFPELKNHKLSNVTNYLKISNIKHRAISDSISVKELYDVIKEIMEEKGLSIKDLWPKTSGGKKKLDVKSIKPTVDEIDEENFFYNKNVVFTGELERMKRKDAVQIIVNLGGIPSDIVTKSTNYLILADDKYALKRRGEKTLKHRKAEKAKMDGQDIEIIDESTFYYLIENKL